MGRCHQEHNLTQHSCRDTKVLFAVLLPRYSPGGSPSVLPVPSPLMPPRTSRPASRTLRLYQSQLAGTCDRFGPPLHLKFAEDLPIVSLHRVQGEEQLLANLLIRESLRNEL